MIATLAGHFVWTRVLLGFSVCVVAGVFLSTFFTILYQFMIYSRVYRPKFNPAYHPRCAVIVPCKGGGTKNYEDNLKSFLKLSYEPYQVIFTVESEADGAVPKIREVIAGNPKASLVVAGLSSCCAQKNFNQLAAIKKADNPEVLVFADVDISPRPEWLSEIVLPLSDSSIAVTTGFRWLHAERGTLAQQAHFYMNAFLYTIYSTASFVGGVGLWGGSMAIRTKDFETLEVAARWSETVVDNSSLSQLLKKRKRRSILVPTCITHTNDLINSVSDATRWFERQMMFLKLYQRSIWIVAIPIIAVCLAAIAWLPLAIFISLVSHLSFFAIGGGASLVLVIGKFAADLMYPALGPMPRFGSFMLLQPAALCVFLISCLRTAFKRTIIWSGIKYRMSFSGKVTGLERI